jgi:hypothetical protein
MMYQMKTTIDIADSLFDRAKRHARKTGRPLRAVVEEGLRRVLEEPRAGASYRLPDRSVGDPKAKNPLASMTWQDLRAQIYGGG